MKRKVSVVLMVLSLGIMGATATASDIAIAEENGVISEETSRVSDLIEMKYRYHNGHLQCRRWNSTKGYWVDADWIDLT